MLERVSPSSSKQLSTHIRLRFSSPSWLSTRHEKPCLGSGRLRHCRCKNRLRWLRHGSTRWIEYVYVWLFKGCKRNSRVRHKYGLVKGDNSLRFLCILYMFDCNRGVGAGSAGLSGCAGVVVGPLLSVGTTLGILFCSIIGIVGACGAIVGIDGTCCWTGWWLGIKSDILGGGLNDSCSSSPPSVLTQRFLSGSHTI